MIDRICLSINNSCNLHCRHCNFRRSDKINDDAMLGKSEIYTILHNILHYSKKNGISSFKMGITGSGEPLFNFNIIKYINECLEDKDVDKIVTFYIITNGTLVNEDILKYLYKKKNQVTLNFSLDGYEELHNYGKEAFNKTLDGIKLYESIFHEKPVLNCTVSRQTLNNKEAVIDYFIKHNFKKINFCQLVDVEDDDLKISRLEYLSFLQFIQSKNAIVFRQNKQDKKYDCCIYGQLCGVGRTNIFVSKQGIYPCFRFYKNDEYKIGSFDAEFHEVDLNLQKLQSVKEGECYYNKYIINRREEL